MLQQKNIYRKMIDKSDWRVVNLNGILRYCNSQPHVISGKHSSHQPLLTFYLWCCSAWGQHRAELCAEWAYIKKDLREGQETVKSWSKTALFFFFNFIFKLYIIVLVLPNIKMNPPQVYMRSPSWTLLPPPSPYHPSGSSQCTSPKHPVSCIEPGEHF